jgi:hypothetical protein
MLAAVLHPFDGPPQFQGDQRQHHLFRIEHALGAKATADIRRDHAHRALVAAEMIGDQAPDHVRHLRRGPNREAIAHRIRHRQHAAAFHRMAAAAMGFKSLGKHVRRVGKNLLDGAEPAMQGRDQIVRRVRMGQRRVWVQRTAPVDHGRQHLVIHLDQRRGVFGNRPALGDHDGDRHPDMADLAVGERLVVQRLLDIPDGNGERHLLAGEVTEIRGRIHRDDPGQFSRGGAVDGDDARMGMTGTNERGVQNAGDVEIIDVAALPGDQPGILDAAHLGAEIAHAHQISPRSTRAASSAASTMVS